MAYPLTNDNPVIEPVNAGTSELNADISNTSHENNSFSSSIVALSKSENSQNPCPTCARFDHPIQSVSFSSVSQVCFFIPNPLKLQTDQPKRRINKVVRTMTDSDIIQQIKEKEARLSDKTQKVGQKRNKSPNQANEKDDDEDDYDDNDDIDFALDGNISTIDMFYKSNVGKQYFSHAQ